MPMAAQILELPPPEEGILRFEFTAEDVGPLGLKFSPGFPPLILQVHPDTHAERKGIPANHEVHAVNGLLMVPQNHSYVMNGLKSRPMILDVRPQGWKPAAILKQQERIRQQEEAERSLKVKLETERREQVAREAAEKSERDAKEKAEREELERQRKEEAKKRAMAELQRQREVDEAWERSIAADDPEPLRTAAREIMDAEHGSSVKVKGRRGLPLRLITRQKEVAWLWAGERQMPIGGGLPDDTWTS